MIDGDTLDIGATPTRLFGIDAPEIAQTCATGRGGEWACGRAALKELEGLTEAQTVTCRGQGSTTTAAFLLCAPPQEGELNETMIRQGLAWAFVRYSDAYVQTEAVARAARKGVFAAQTVLPWEFRARRWEGAIQTAEADRPRRSPIDCDTVSPSAEAAMLLMVPTRRVRGASIRGSEINMFAN